MNNGMFNVGYYADDEIIIRTIQSDGLPDGTYFWEIPGRVTLNSTPNKVFSYVVEFDCMMTHFMSSGELSEKLRVAITNAFSRNPETYVDIRGIIHCGHYTCAQIKSMTYYYEQPSLYVFSSERHPLRMEGPRLSGRASFLIEHKEVKMNIPFYSRVCAKRMSFIKSGILN